MHLVNTIAIALASLATFGQAQQYNNHQKLHHRRQYGNNTMSWAPGTTSSSVASFVMSTSGPASSSIAGAIGSSSAPASSLPFTASLINTVSTTVSDSTLTYTLGNGAVVTTTIHMTKTFTETDTIYINLPTGGLGDSGLGDINTQAANVASSTAPWAPSYSPPVQPAATSSAGLATTITDSSTTFATLTVTPLGSGTGLAATSAAAGTGSSGAEGSCVMSVVTVTTRLQSTITVTANASPSSSAATVSAAAFFSNGTDTTSVKNKLAGTGFVTMSALPTNWKV